MTSWPTQLRYREGPVDADNLAQVASGTTIRVNILGPGSGPSRFRQVSSPDHWALDWTDLNSRLHADGGMQSGMGAILFVLGGNESTICRLPMQTASLIFLPPGASIEANFRPGLRWTGTVMDTDRWARVQQRATGVVAEPQSGPAYFARLPSERASILADAFERAAGLLARDRESPITPIDRFEDFSEHLADALVAMEDRYDALDRRASRLYRQAMRARDFICAHIEEPLSITRICLEVGVSRRQLEYAFSAVFEMPPHTFIYTYRLNAVRRALIRARGTGATVTEIALDYGVTHLGRFSVAYRSLFGESPRRTIGVS